MTSSKPPLFCTSVSNVGLMVLSADGNFIATASHDRTIKLWSHDHL